MFAIIFVACFIFLAGFLIGWGVKSDMRDSRPRSKLPEDKIIEEMRLQRAHSYLNYHANKDKND